LEPVPAAGVFDVPVDVEGERAVMEECRKRSVPCSNPFQFHIPLLAHALLYHPSMRPAAPAAILALALLAGCSDPGSAVGFNEKDPAARFRATRQAAQTNDKDSIPALIQRLESDDPAERMLAIHTLNRLTGQTLGYDHAAPRDDRDVAIGRWADWYNQQQQPLPQKADK